MMDYDLPVLSVESWTLLCVFVALLALFYDGRQPVLAVMDTGMIKTILVKECYSVFTNRRDFGLNGPLQDAVSVLEDEDWKRMYQIMLNYSNTVVESLRQKTAAGEVIEVKEIFGPYSMDVVTSTAFSVDIDSLNKPADPFVTNIKKLVKFNFLSPLLILVVLFPFLGRIFDKMEVSLFPADVLEFFYSSLKKIKDDRKMKTYNKRVDFMQLMVDSQTTETSNEDKTSQKGLSDHEILSQAMIFIFAGYETSSSTLSYVAYNLATHPDVQTALQNEIDETFENKTERFTRNKTTWIPYAFLPFGVGPKKLCVAHAVAVLMMKLCMVENSSDFQLFVTCKETEWRKRRPVRYCVFCWGAAALRCCWEDREEEAH
ncbi:hypothetical protein CRUP_005463 [Coryphaenoides rupestris]|nr:hypothetical protein CRUP_005463 [Coryphaenoides rupestris]